MELVERYGPPAGRAMMALIFVLSGLMKLMDPAGNAAYIESGGLPGFLVWPTIVLELGGGIALALGWQTRIAALLLAAFTLLAGLLYHFVPMLSAEGMMAQMQMIMVLKNIAMAGGLIFMAALGAGSYAMDNRGTGGRARTA